MRRFAKVEKTLEPSSLVCSCLLHKCSAIRTIIPTILTSYFYVILRENRDSCLFSKAAAKWKGAQYQVPHLSTSFAFINQFVA